MYKDIFPKRDKSFLFLLFVSILCILFCIKSVYAEDSITQNAKKSDPLPHEKYRKDFVYFPFGSGKTVIIPVKVRSLLGDNYKVNLIFDFIDGQKIIDQYAEQGDMKAFSVIREQEKIIKGKDYRYPFAFIVKGYKISKKNKKLFYEETFFSNSKIHSGTFASPANFNNRAFRNRYTLKRLGRGNYEFKLIDISPQSKYFSNINSYVSILKQDFSHY